MNLLLLLSHSIEEYDQVKLLSGLGYDVFSIGAYSDPANPSDDKRPALPEVPYHPELAGLCHAQREKHSSEDASYVIDWAKGDLHPDLIDWADAIIVHHFTEPWLTAQWRKIGHKRVIWRTVGQSNPSLEAHMLSWHHAGLQIVRYSPKEQTAFEKLGAFAGQDALIRFYKDPQDWYGWTGDDPVIGNVTQNMAERGDHCGLSFWHQATYDLPTKPAGPGSEALGGLGSLPYDEMRAYLRRIRAYLYTGTQPASYTLGLIEAMMTGVPVVSISPERMWLPDLYEGNRLAMSAYNDPRDASYALRKLLDLDKARKYSAEQAEYMGQIFSPEVIGSQWRAFLG